MNFLHCFYGVGAVISPYIMSLALRTARWNEGYRWTAFLQTGILPLFLLAAAVGNIVLLEMAYRRMRGQ